LDKTFEKNASYEITQDKKKYTKKQKEPGKNTEDISGCVRLEIVNKRLNSIIVT